MSDVGTIYLRLRLVDEWMNEWMQMQWNECNAMQWMFEQFEQRVFWINKYFPNNVVGPFMFLFFAVCDVDRCSWRPFLHRGEQHDTFDNNWQHSRLLRKGAVRAICQ